jgi:hypothetical protein
VSAIDVRGRVEQLLKQTLGAHELVVDAFGNWPVRFGSAVYYVRFMQPPQLPPVVQVFSPVIGDVPKSVELLDAVNAINAQISFGRVAWVNGVVVASAELLAQSLDLPELQACCGTIAQVADAYDDALQTQFGGTKAFPDQPQESAAQQQTPQQQDQVPRQEATTQPTSSQDSISALTEEEAIIELDRVQARNRMIQQIIDSQW